MIESLDDLRIARNAKLVELDAIDSAIAACLRKVETVKRGTYIGSIEKLRGKGAVLRPQALAIGLVSAQFDDSGLERNGLRLCYGWHAFEAADFEVVDADAVRLRHMAQTLIGEAAHLGYIVTIEQKALRPLGMGNATPEVSIRLHRSRYGVVLTHGEAQ